MSYLSDLQPGESAYISSVKKSGLCTRLYDLGFVSNTVVECVAKASFGGPSAYLIRGAVIAIRQEDAGLVFVQRIPSLSKGGKK